MSQHQSAVFQGMVQTALRSSSCAWFSGVEVTALPPQRKISVFRGEVVGLILQRQCGESGVGAVMPSVQLKCVYTGVDAVSITPQQLSEIQGEIGYCLLPPQYPEQLQWGSPAGPPSQMPAATTAITRKRSRNGLYTLLPSSSGRRESSGDPGMLSEGYLYQIQHWHEEDLSIFHQKSIDETSAELTSVCGQSYSSVHKTWSRKFFNKFGSTGKHASGAQSKETTQSKEQNNKMQQEFNNLIAEMEITPSVEIMGCSNSDKETFLVPSSCKDICIDYNDLHVAGDQVMAMNSDLHDLSCNSSFEFCEGPFLQSSQIPPTTESINDVFKKPVKPDSSCWKVGSFKDKSIMQDQKPLSNSVLNEYLERKVIELYKQYIMDMSCSTTPTDLMASELVMNNVQQISMQISREQNMETSKAKDMVISFLLRLASGKQSNIISTPDLQISSDDA
ncbi:TLR adapter interacting with SLC15A4 on the lysosome [Rhinophrynus dorsalis]